jgi:hypothetical protein
MKLAVATRNGSPTATDLLRADHLTIFERRHGHFEPIETRPLPLAAPDAPFPAASAWLASLHGCSGLLARAIPPRLSLTLQQHRIYSLSSDGFGPHGLFEALDFLHAISQSESYQDGAGI